jgi:hypothetical protein
MLVIAATLGGLLALLVGLLAIPVVFVIDAERGETVSTRWRVSWLYGLVTFRSSGRKPASSMPASETHQVQVSSKSRKRRGRVVLAVLRTRGLVRRVVRVAIALLRKLTLERFHFSAAFGFEDPADTGFVYGCLSPVFVLAATRGLDIRCMPMFLEPGVRGVVGATIRTRPLSVLSTIIAFFVSPPVIRAIGAAWRAKRRPIGNAA